MDMKKPTEGEQITEEVTDEELAETLKEEEIEEKPEAIETPVEAETTPMPVEEKEEAKPKKKAEEEEDIVEEKTFTIPLGKALIMPPRKRAPRAIHMIQAFIIKHMKIPSRAEEDEEPPQLSLTKEVNEHVWAKGIEKPPRKIRVRATKDKDGNVKVHLAEGA